MVDIGHVKCREKTIIEATRIRGSFGWIENKKKIKIVKNHSTKNLNLAGLFYTFHVVFCVCAVDSFIVSLFSSSKNNGVCI